MKKVKSTRLPRSTPVENDDTIKRLENGSHGSNGAAVASLGCDPGSGKEDRKASASLSNGGSAAAAAAAAGIASSSESKIYGTLTNGHWCTRSHHVNGNHVTSPPPAERTSAHLPKEPTQISPQTSPEVVPLSPGYVIPSPVYLSTELSNKTRDDGEARNRAPDMADLALVYFPLTMKLAGSKSRPSNGETKHSASSKHSQKSRTNGGHRRYSRSASTMSSSSSNSNGSYDRMHLTDFELGTGSPNVLLSSPYEPTLTHLRLERLRIEEEHILEMKRKDELEKTRGPCPNWYMLKSSDFSRELKKHNELMNNKHSCQEMFHYRSTLELASKNFRDIQSNSN